MKRRVIIFIDGNNWDHNLKKIVKPSKIDFQKLAELICNHFNFELVEIRYYNSVLNIEDSREIYYKHQEFLSELRKKELIVKTRKLKKVKEKEIQIEKGIDVMIASEMISKSLIEKKCDCCILISGDADFIPAMEIIKNAKKEVITVSVIEGYSRELLQGRFRYLILTKDDLELCKK